jgi:Domain of unknown function (DUF4153)
MTWMSKAIEQRWLHPALGAVAGGLIWLLSKRTLHDLPDAVSVALIIAIVSFSAAWLLTLSAKQWRPGLGYAAVLAAVLGLLGAGLFGRYGSSEEYGSATGTTLLMWALYGLAYLTLPFWQTAQAAGRWHPDYPGLHRHAWNAPLQLLAAMLFAGLVWGLLRLLAALLDLVGLNLFTRILEESLFNSVLFGAAFGLGMAVLRERDAIIAAAREIVIKLLAVLTPLIAVATVLFLGSLPFTGLAPLWATDSATPILIGVFLAGVLTVNAVIDDRDEEATASPTLKVSARVLAVVQLPITLIAAYSLWLRIDQYGLTPDRMIGAIIVLMAVGYGLAYVTALVRRWADWRAALRRVNVALRCSLLPS